MSVEEFQTLARKHLSDTVLLEFLLSSRLHADEKGQIQPQIMDNLRVMFRTAERMALDATVKKKVEKMLKAIS